jgi:hypothetical protein
MNNDRRKMLQQAAELINQAETLVEEVLAAEQAAFENLPESLQGADSGIKMQDAITTLQDDLPGHFEELRSSIDVACQ